MKATDGRKEKMEVSKEEIKRVKGIGFLLNRGTGNFNARVVTGNGTLTGEQMRRVGQIAEAYGNGVCMFTSRQCVEVAGIPFEKIDAVREELDRIGLTTGGTGTRVRPVTACKGKTCVFGFYDTQALAKKIHERFFVGMGSVNLPHKFKIAVGGCPNSCIKPSLNDFGIVGQHPPKLHEDLCRGCKKCETFCRMGCMKVVDGKMQRDTSICNNCGFCVGKCPFQAIYAEEVRYKLYIGGRWGRITRNGTALPGLYTEEQAMDLIERSMLLFRDWGKKGERFAAMIDRIGEEKVIDQLLHGDLIARREEILAKEL